MFATGHTQHPRDRRHDRPTVIDGLAKPPVLRRATIRAGCAAYLLLIAYGTLGPFRSADGPWLSPPAAWHWLPPATPLCLAHYDDLFTNVLIYIPVGIALALLVRRRGGGWAAEITVAMYLAVAVSYATELLQQFMPTRVSDRTDLIVNTSAALFGCLIAPRCQRAIRHWHELAFWSWRTRPWLVLAWLDVAFTFLLMTVPWDLTWPSLEKQWDRELDLLDFRRFAAFTLLGFVTTMAMIERVGRGGRACGEAVKRVFVCAVMFEAAQILLKSHACGLLDISTGFAGGLVGCGAARWLTGMGMRIGVAPSARARVLATLGLLAIVGAVLCAGLAKARPEFVGPYGANVLWLPFQNEFFEPFDRVLTSVAESLFLYGALTVVCLYVTAGRGRTAALMLLGGLVGTVELAQMHFLGGTADVTPVVLAVVAWLVTTRCWDSLDPRGPCPERDPQTRPTLLAH